MSQAYIIAGGNTISRQQKMLEIFDKIKPDRKPENDPDTQIIDSQTSIKIDQVRDLKRLLSLKPYYAPPKIALIPEAEKLTFEAQGALLKLLEEPPGETIFVLTTAQAENLLPTIVSRCQMINLPPESEISLTEEEIKNYQEELAKILKSSPGERIKFTEQIKSREEAEKFCQIQLFLWRERLLKNPTTENTKVLREIQKTLKYLAANVNPRLALENLLLSYPHHQ